jgi:hypothetical protein
MATAAGIQMLELNGVMSRAEKVRFDLVDPSGRVLGELNPIVPCTIENDSSQQIKRKLSNFRLAASEFNEVNPLVHRVRPSWVLSTGDEWPEGEFLFADAQTGRYSYGRTLTATLVDKGLLLGQTLAQPLSFPKGTTASAAIVATVNAAGIYGASIAPSSYTFGSPLAYPQGGSGVTYAKVLSDICAKAGYYDPYFDNAGVLQVRSTVTVASVTPSLNYVDGGRIIAGSITESNDLLAAPNRFLVIDTSATTGAVAYEWTIPASAPHSYENRGFYITHTIEAPGVGNVTQAEAVGAAYYASNPWAYETVVFSSPADPRHDTFDVINFRGANYLETKWSLVCAPGGPMTHTGVRVYV